MTDEEINRKFETVANHLATLAVAQQKTEERMNLMADSEKRMWDRLSRAERMLMLAIRAGGRERREWRERHAALVEAQARTEGALKELAESQKHTDARLDALIDIVREGRERRRNGRDGEGPGGGGAEGGADS